MLQALTQTQPSSREKAAVKEFFGSQTESYTDEDGTFSEEETRDDGASFVTEKSGFTERSGITEKSGGDAQVRVAESDETTPVDENAPDENAPVAAPLQKNSLRSPKILSKLKPFSPRSLTSPKKKPNHFFSEPSPKSKPSPKMSVMKRVLSPRSSLSPKKPTAAVVKQSVEERVSLAVAPGRLGLSLKIDKQNGGAMIMSVHPRCAFHGKVDIGDQIVYIDDRKVKTLQDFKVGSDKHRNFIVRRNKKTSDDDKPSNNISLSPSSKVSAVTEPEDDSPVTPAEASLADDLSQNFSLVEMNTSFADEKLTEGDVGLGSPAESCDGSKNDAIVIEENHELQEFEANKGACAFNSFNCAEGSAGIIGGFYTNKFSCAKSVASDSNSSIKTFLKPITKLMECGQAESADYAIYSGDFDIEPAAKMSDEVPSMEKISELQIGDHAFIRRSNGQWTYSIVLDVSKDSISFSVDDFGNGKTITKHRWLSSIRLVTASAEDDFESTIAEETIAEEYSTSLSSSGSEDDSEVASPLESSNAIPSDTADRKAELKAMVEKKKMDLKTKKREKKKQAKKAKAAAAEAKRKLKSRQEQEKKRKKRQAKAAAAEAKRKERDLKAEKELEVKLRLMHLEEVKLEAERERQRMKEEEKAKKIHLEELKLQKEEAAERERLRMKEEKKAKKMTELEEKKRKKQAKENGKVEMKKLQKARKQAAALEAQRQADLLFKNFETASGASEDTRDVKDATETVKDEVSNFVDEFFLCEM